MFCSITTVGAVPMMYQSEQSATRQTLSVGMMYGMVLPASCQATVYEVCKVVPSCCGAYMCATQSDLRLVRIKHIVYVERWCTCPRKLSCPR